MRLILLLLLFIVTKSSYGQCCSAGNPIGAAANIGILDSGAVRIIFNFRNSVSEGYWEGSSKSSFGYVKKASFNATGLTLSYGLSKGLNIEGEFGYYINKSQTYNLDPEFENVGFGLSNGIISLKQNLILKPKTPLEWTIGAGVKFPFSEDFQEVNNVELPRDVQPSTNSYGVVLQSFFYRGLKKKRMKFILVNRFESNTPDIKNFRYGNLLVNSLFLTKQIKKSNWTSILQLRHEYRARDIRTVVESSYLGFVTSGSVVEYSGGNLAIISPQINYSLGEKWNISVLTDIPVLRSYNGIQLGNKYSFAFYLSYDIGNQDSCEVSVK